MVKGITKLFVICKFIIYKLLIICYYNYVIQKTLKITLMRLDETQRETIKLNFLVVNNGSVSVN